MKLPSASRLALAERCIGAAVLPAVQRPSTDAQAAGTGRHRFLERAREVGREQALAEIPAGAPWRATCAGIDLDALPVGRHEVAYAYDPATDTARELGAALGRDYSAAHPGEVTGTADLVVSGDVPLVVDFKGSEHVGPAGEHLQLGFYALCAARVAGAEEVDTAIVYLHSDGRAEWDRARLTAWDLAALAGRIAELTARVAEADEALASGRLPTLVEGHHCLRCASLTLCPAQVELARTMALAIEQSPSSELLARLAPLEDTEAGAALDRLERVAEVIDLQVKALRERATRTGLPLPDGSRLVPIESTRREVLVDKALPLLAARFGAQLDALIERSVSVGDLRALARQLDPDSPRKAGDALLEELSQAGALKTSTFVTLRRRAGARKD